MAQRGRGGGEGVRTRDHLANSRTLQAWFRASLALLAIGYALEKLRLLTTPASGATAIGSLSRLGRWVALGGVGIMALALVRFLLHRREIEGAAFRPRLAADVALIAAMALSGLVVVAVLVASR